jgi:hypothetical protein
MQFYEKIKLWFKSTGLTNLAYLAIGIGGKLLLGSGVLLGAGLGIFLYINFNVIRKLFNSATEKEFQEKV